MDSKFHCSFPFFRRLFPFPHLGPPPIWSEFGFFSPLLSRLAIFCEFSSKFFFWLHQGVHPPFIYLNAPTACVSSFLSPISPFPFSPPWAAVRSAFGHPVSCLTRTLRSVPSSFRTFFLVPHRFLDPGQKSNLHGLGNSTLLSERSPLPFPSALLDATKQI